jgi:integrase/recombinase XerD
VFGRNPRPRKGATDTTGCYFCPKSKPLADYIKLERVTTDRSLFVISRPPHRPFKDAQVLNDIFGKAYDKTGLKPPAPYVGVHILRQA